MTNVYGRKYSLIFGKPAYKDYRSSGVINPNISSSVLTNASPTFSAQQYETIPDNYHEITDLHMVAVIPQSLTAEATGRDKGYIEIYNASEETIKKLQNSTHVFLRAGYQQDPELQYIFVGDIQKVTTERRNSDIVSSIICGQKLRVGRDVRVQKTYVPPMSFAAIIRDLTDIASSNGINIGKITLPSSTLVLDDRGESEDAVETHINSPIVAEGYILDEISNIAAQAKCRSYMVMGKLYIEPIAATKILEVYNVTQDNVQGGINRSQTIGDSGINTKEEISLRLFLDPRVVVGSYINIDWKNYNDVRGVFKVTKVEHLLEYEGTNWTTEITALRADNV